jgi:tripartite ATP-independent transporter DctP family solute receptor
MPLAWFLRFSKSFGSQFRHPNSTGAGAMASKQIKGRADKTDKASGRLLPRRNTLTRRSALKGGLWLGAGLTAGAFGIIGRATAAPVTMRFGSDSPIGAPHTKSALVLKELVEKGTAGRVEVTIFPDGQVGSNGPMTNSVKAGTLDAVVTDVTYLSTAVAEADVFNLPFLYTDTAQVLRFANGPVGARLKPKINEAFACEALGFATDGSRNLWNSRRPIRTPADIEGLKIGVQPSKIQRDTILAFGGIPTVVAFNALYTSLQTGLIDGSDKAFADMLELKIYQVTKYLTLTSHYSIVNVLIVSKKFMDKLSPQDQEVVRAAGKPAVDAQIDEILKGEKAAIALLQEKGVQIIAMENPKAFSAKMDSVYKDAADRIGADMIEQARNFS